MKKDRQAEDDEVSPVLSPPKKLLEKPTNIAKLKRVLEQEKRSHDRKSEPRFKVNCIEMPSFSEGLKNMIGEWK